VLPLLNEGLEETDLNIRPLFYPISTSYDFYRGAVKMFLSFFISLYMYTKLWGRSKTSVPADGYPNIVFLRKTITIIRSGSYTDVVE